MVAMTYKKYERRRTWSQTKARQFLFLNTTIDASGGALRKQTNKSLLFHMESNITIIPSIKCRFSGVVAKVLYGVVF